MHPEWPILAREAGLPAGGVHRCGQGSGIVGAGAEAQPNHARGAPAAEGAGGAEAQLKPGAGALEPVGDCFDHGALDAPYKPNREVQVLGWCPAEIGRQLRASGDETCQLFALRIGHREPEEGADLQRARGFFQFSWTHELGRVGRQP